MKKIMSKLCISGLVLVLPFVFSEPVQAAIDAYEFDNEDQQNRFYELTEELRCPRCLNTNLAGSDAPIALDLRAEVYEQIMAGQSNAEIVSFMRERYGDFITYRPPLNSGTVLLWFGPLALLLLGLAVIVRMSRSRKAAADTSLSAEEREKLQHLLSSRQD